MNYVFLVILVFVDDYPPLKTQYSVLAFLNFKYRVLGDGVCLLRYAAFFDFGVGVLIVVLMFSAHCFFDNPRRGKG